MKAEEMHRKDAGVIMPYPRQFADDAAEVIWLQSRVAQLQGEIAYLLELRRVKASVEYDFRDLVACLEDRNKQLQGQIADVERENARLNAKRN